MSYKEEILYRKELLSKVRMGLKITPEERLWLETHTLYNSAHGYPYLNRDIIQLQPGVNYRLLIRVETYSCANRILPIISVPGGKGKIVANRVLLTLDNKEVSPQKPVKCLGILIDKNNRETEIAYQSKLGLLGVSYECEYLDDKQPIMNRKSSSVGDFNFVMIGENLANNKRLYHCKVPTSKEFGEYAFSIEWEPVSDLP